MTYIISEGITPEEFQKKNYEPTPRRDFKKFNGTDLQQWVNSIGGVSSVADRLGYSVRQFERYFSGQAEIPKVIKEFVKISDRNLKLMDDNAKLRRSKNLPKDTIK